MGLAVRVARSGLAVFNAPQYLKQMDVDGKVALGYGGGHTLHTKLLTMSTGGQVDVGDSSLVVQAVSGTRDAVLGQVTSWVISALQSEAGHPWEGAGITSSLAASNSLAGVAVSINDLGGGQRIRPDLDVYAVIAKATWDGDLNLDGVVNLNDYFRMDSGYLAGAKGYTNGDINYDGAINLNDYFLMDAAYLGQSQVLAGSSAMVIIPEPGVVGIWGLAMAFGLRRRGGRRVR
jgi:hypothetical protein